MHGQIFFGLELRSPIHFEVLLPNHFKKPNDEILSISIGSVPSNLQDVAWRSADMEIGRSGSILIRDQSVGRFLISNGRRIDFEPTAPLNERAVQSLLVTSIASAILHQRKQIPLHACCVSFEGKTIALLGPSGRGKSTLTAILVQSGAMLVSEDITVVRLVEGEPRVIGGPLGIKLLRDSAALVGEDNLHGLVAPSHPKFLWNKVGDGYLKCAKLDLVFRIEIEDEKNGIGIVPWGKPTLDALYGINVAYHLGHLEWLYNAFCDFISKVPCFVLRRPRNLKDVSRAVSLVRDVVRNS